MRKGNGTKSGTVCNDVRTFALLLYCISIDGGVLKRKIQVYIFWTLTQGPSVKSRTADESSLVLRKQILQFGPGPVAKFFDFRKKITALGLSLNITRNSSSAL